MSGYSSGHAADGNPGVHFAPGGQTPSSAFLERAALLHAGALLVFATWAFGGNIGWARVMISWWGCPGLMLTLAALRHRGWRPAARWLWPLAAYHALVLAACLNPTFAPRTLGGEIFLIHTGGITWFPGSAQPAASLRALWIFDAMFFPFFNLLLLVRRRRVLRGLMMVAAANALALSVFGIVQKLVGAQLFFGAQKSPNPFFFATFIYHNHWAAYLVLSLAACLGLVFHHAGQNEHRDFWHSPAFAGAVGAGFMALTAPLSESRAGTLLTAALLGTALAQALRLRRRSPSPAISRAALAVAALLAVAGLGFAAYKLDQRGLSRRAELTGEQLEEMRAEGGLGSRATLYHDTWRMAREHFWTGWGLDSYSTVFMLYNTQKSVDTLPVYYADAHSDWLQSVAETGCTGTALLGLTCLLPLAGLRRRQLRSPLIRYLFFGCALVLLYAWVEFPFECPAVATAFWLNFFAAVRLAQLSTADPESA